MTQEPETTPPIEAPEPTRREEAVAFLGVTQTCSDTTHPSGIHRHGDARYIRRPVRSTRKR